MTERGTYWYILTFRCGNAVTIPGMLYKTGRTVGHFGRRLSELPLLGRVPTDSTFSNATCAGEIPGSGSGNQDIVDEKKECCGSVMNKTARISRAVGFLVVVVMCLVVAGDKTTTGGDPELSWWVIDGYLGSEPAIAAVNRSMLERSH